MDRHNLELYIVAVWTAISPIHPTLAMAVALPIADLILACVAAWKTKKLAPHSHGIGRTVGKICLYLATVCLAFATERWMTGSVGILAFVNTVIGARELKSCLEHLDEIHGGSLLSSSIDFLVSKSASKASKGEPPDA